MNDRNLLAVVEIGLPDATLEWSDIRESAMDGDEIRTLKSGILLGECPRWHGGRLYFADWVSETIHAVSEDGDSQTFARIASLPLSFDWLPDGRMLIVNARQKKLQLFGGEGLADFLDLGKFEHGCNEIVVDATGRIYVNNVNYRFPGGDFRPGFIALITPDGKVLRQEHDLAFPNGMVITPDGKTLVCAESMGGTLAAFDIAADGSLVNRRVWAKIGEWGGDGITMDAEGAIWTSVGPRCIRVREGGDVLEEFTLDRMAFALMLGGADGKTLFVCANEWTGSVDVTKATGLLLARRVSVPHAGFPRAG